MGTWGTSAFEDDTAMEFYEEFCYGDQSISEIEAAIDRVLEQQYNMDELLMEGFEEPVQAIMAAEIVATALGNRSAEYPSEELLRESEIPAIDWTALKASIDPELIGKIGEAIAKIKSDNTMHLHVLWLESESFENWKNYLDELTSRIKNPQL